MRLTEAVQKLYGREKEVQILRSALERAKSINPQARSVPIVFVGGLSGTGKTTLIEHAFWKSHTVDSSRKSGKQTRCLLGCGKYGLTKDPTPYGTLLAALRQISKSMLKSPERQTYATLVKDEFHTDDLRRLSDRIPELAQLITEERIGRITPSSSTETLSSLMVGATARSSIKYSKEEVEQLKYTIRTFLRVIASPERPVVLYLDDIQWIDSLTLSVLEATLLDNELKHLVFVSSFRSNVVYPQVCGSATEDSSQKQHKVASFIDTLKHSSRAPEIQEVTVQNLQSSEIQPLLEDVLHTDSDTDKLANLFVERTEGNCFHVVQLLGFLETKGLLQYNEMQFRWTWDLERIRNETMVTSNVADILKSKIEVLSQTETEVLKHCACLGYRFHVSLMHMMEERLAEGTTNSKSFCEVLLNERLLERVGPEYLKFTHDKVHQAALDLCPDNSERETIHFALGMEIYSRFFENEGEAAFEQDDKQLLFLCVDCLNAGIETMDKTDPELNLRLINLNFHAARLAADIAAFDYSLVYAQNGLGLLQQLGDYWNEHYHLALDLHTLIVRMWFCTGSNKDEGLTEVINLIVEKSKSEEHTLDARATLMEYLATQNKYSQMVTSVSEILERYGEGLPEKLSLQGAQAEYKRIKTELEAISDSDFRNLPLISEHPLKDFCIRMLDILYHPLDHVQHGQIIQTLCSCKMVDITLRYGLGGTSASGLACFANCTLAEFVDTKLSARCRSLAMSLFEEFKAESATSEPGVRLGVYGGLYSWSEPLSTGMDNILETYRIGMRTGMITHGFMAIVGYSWAYFYSGLALGPLIVDLSKFIDQMAAYRQNMCVFLCLPALQAALNLTGVAPIEGTSRRWNNHFGAVKDCDRHSIFDLGGGVSKSWRARLRWNGKIGAQSDLSYRLQVAIFCRNYDLSAATMNELLHSDPTGSTVLKAGYYYGLARGFYIALVAYWQVKRCSKLNVVKRQRYLKEARKYHDMLRSWVVEHGNINLPQKLFILDAEELSLIKVPSGTKGEEIRANLKAAYEKAIVASIRSGFTQDGALAAQLAAEAIPSERASYWQRAREFYLKWGAAAVVEYVESHHLHGASKVEDPSQDGVVSPVGNGRGFRARTRFSEVASASEQDKLTMAVNGSGPERIRLSSGSSGT